MSAGGGEFIHFAPNNLARYLHFGSKRLKNSFPGRVLDQEDVSDDDSDLSSEGEDNGNGEERVIAEFCQVSDIGSGGALGDWERHTKVDFAIEIVK